MMHFFMLNVKTFMAFLLGYVEMELGTYYSKWLKRQNRAYRPVLYLSASARSLGRELSVGKSVSFASFPLIVTPARPLRRR